MNISNLLSDETILAEIGERIARHRLDKQMTQAQLAEQAGVSKRTVERVEAGASAQLATIVRIFRVLGLLPGLERMIPEPSPSPMDLLKRKGKQRQRASSPRDNDEAEEPWSWGDDA